MMAKLMWICGILLIAAGVALGIVALVSAAPPAGVDLQTAAILLVGGVLSLGLGSVIDGQANGHAGAHARSLMPEPMIPAKAAIPEYDPRGAKPAATAPEAAVAAATAVIMEKEVSRPTRDTIQALEQARQKIEQAFDARTSEAPAATAAEVEETFVASEETVVEEEVASEDDATAEEETITEEEVMDEGQLYVVEERIIRRHPARILSDGTVEAETAEGWMRFENLEHLDEYLDAMDRVRS